MKLNNIRLLVKDFDSCFSFYAEKVGLAVSWGKPGGDYASFDIGIDSNKLGLSIFKTDLMAQALGNSDRPLPENCREKAVIVIQVDDVDTIFKELTARGIDFINAPRDIPGWGGRVAHFRDPEDNLIEIYAELSKDKWSENLIEESKDYDS
jgi:predicted enzyme related to lactoylglutathione lyase